MDDTERLEAMRRAATAVGDVNQPLVNVTDSDPRVKEYLSACRSENVLWLLTRLEETEIRNLQYDNIVRGVCNDLGIDEGAGCDEIAMASANARSLRDRMIEVVERDCVGGFCSTSDGSAAKAEILTALKEIDMGQKEEKP